jgi:hypothetical protein
MNSHSVPKDSDGQSSCARYNGFSSVVPSKESLEGVENISLKNPE